jgi:hypothetical protein
VRWAPAPRRVLSARRRHGARASPQHTSTSVSQRRGERRSFTPLPAEETVLGQTLPPCRQLILGLKGAIEWVIRRIEGWKMALQHGGCDKTS